MNNFDIIFIGHMAIDEVHHQNGSVSVNPGSAVLCGAMAAAKVGAHVAVITRMALRDRVILSPLIDAGVDILLKPSSTTTYIQVIHPSDDMDERELIQVKCASRFQEEDIQDINGGVFHLAGISDQEFSLLLLRSIKAKGFCLSADMQSFVRQVHQDSGQIFFRDVKEKKEIFSLLDIVKMDVVEAKILTGSDDIVKAAEIIASYGCEEVIITNSDGVFGFVNGQSHFSHFSNRSVIGRTGRGDTTHGAYLTWRKGHTLQEALDFAAALASIKMEREGPFSGDLDSVLTRMSL